MDFAILNGPQAERSVTGSGHVASLQLMIHEASSAIDIRIEDTPLLETRLVLPDGTTELAFETLNGITLGEAAQTSVADGSWGRLKAEAVTE